MKLLYDFIVHISIKRFRETSSLSKICDGENLWQWSLLDNASHWSSISKKQFVIKIVKLLRFTVMNNSLFLQTISKLLTYLGLLLWTIICFCRQSFTNYLAKKKKIKQNGTRQEKFNVCLYANFDPFCQTLQHATSNTELFATKVSGCRLLTTTTKNSPILFTNEGCTLLSTLINDFVLTQALLYGNTFFNSNF